MAPPAASAHCRAAAKPSTTATMPTAPAPSIVVRKDRATTLLVATGSTMSAATRSTPVTRIAAATVTAVRAARSALSTPTGMPATCAASSSSTTANNPRRVSPIATMISAPNATTV